MYRMNHKPQSFEFRMVNLSLCLLSKWRALQSCAGTEASDMRNNRSRWEPECDKKGRDASFNDVIQ